MTEKIGQIKKLLKEIPWQSEKQEKQVESILSSMEAELDSESPVLKESWYLAEGIDEKGIYSKNQYRKVEQISFFIRPLREWFFPCEECQRKLKGQLQNGTWILGNKDYEPMIELNTTKNEIDDDSWFVVETHKATAEELKRLGLEGWKDLGRIEK